MSETEGFFARLCATLHPDERITIWSLPGRKSRHLPPDPVQLARVALELNAEGRDVYFGVCPRTGDLGEHRRGGHVDVARVQALWVDVDVAHPTHAARNLPPGAIDAAALLSGLPEPTTVVWSGGGIHAYWVLSEPITRESGARACETIQEHVRGNARARGWHLDATANPDRVLRVPGTINRKDPDDLRPCTVIDDLGHTYTVEQIVGALATPTTASAPSRHSLPATSPPHGGAGVASAPTLPGADARALTLEALRRMRDSGRPGSPLAAAILSAAPLVPGERDTELTRMAGMISMICPEGADADDLAELLFPVVDATAAEHDDPKNPAPTRRNAADKLERAVRQARRKRAQEAADRQALQRGLIRAARASAQTRASALDAEPDEEPEEPSDRTYSAEEIREFEAEHGVPLQWIVQHQGAHYVLVGGRYQGPIVQTDLDVNLRRTLAPTTLELTTWEGGEPRPMTAPEILRRHSTDAHKIIADLRISSSRWDREARTFHEACAPLRPIVPRHDDAIQRWLELLGGEYAQKLLDWVACVTRLDHQCAALYLSKNTGSGKSMLVAGLARLWGAAPTALENIVGAWNTDLTRCPLVVADEHLPPSWTSTRSTASAELRRLVGTSTRTLTRKFLPNVDLEGAVRLVLISNDKNMLPTDESLGANDLEAIGGRFLHIRTSAEAAAYIQSLGGKSGRTRDWVSGDRIAAHALWLRDHRRVTAGSRFIVEGEAPAVQEDLVTETRIGSLVCEVIARTLAASRPMAAGGAPAVRAGGGRLLVSTAGVTDQWKYCVESDPVASTAKIGRQLSLMSSGVAERVRGMPYYVVHPEHVLRWAERYMVGDVDLMRAKIEGVIVDIQDAKK